VEQPFIETEIASEKNDTIWNKFKFQINLNIFLDEANGDSVELANDGVDFIVFTGPHVGNGFFEMKNVFEGDVDDRVGVHSSGLLLSERDEKGHRVFAGSISPTVPRLAIKFHRLADEPFPLVLTVGGGKLGVLEVDLHDLVAAGRSHLDELVFRKAMKK
jgi:hypothetical protein